LIKTDSEVIYNVTKDQIFLFIKDSWKKQTTSFYKRIEQQKCVQVIIIRILKLFLKDHVTMKTFNDAVPALGNTQSMLKRGRVVVVQQLKLCDL